jgi:putative tryptophan/tyrosine transport system substrate-binding protein
MRLIGSAVGLAAGLILSPYAAGTLSRRLEMRRLAVRCHALATIAWLLTAMLTAPLAAEAQSRIPSIGVLMPGPVAQRLHMIEALRQGLREQGYVEGQNITLVVRSADGVMERLPALAEELVRHPVDVILAPGATAIAAKQVTSTTPVVIAVGDALAMGLVTNLARPGGNITGISEFAPEIIAKRLQLLKQAAPAIARVAVLVNPSDPGKSSEQRALQEAARALNITLQVFDVRVHGDLGTAFAGIAKQQPDALITFEDALTMTYRHQLIEFAAAARLPAIFAWPDFVRSGALMAYGPRTGESFRRAAIYMDKILRGAKPGDLPIEQPTKFEFGINLKTARALGLEISPTLLLQATEVIQ